MRQTVVIAFDFGTKRIGCALGQSIMQIARPLSTIAAKDGQPDWHCVQAVIDEWQPNLLLVGLPLNMNGTEQDITHRASKFARQLKERFSISVYTIDERLTTTEARSRAFDQGGYRAIRKSEIDSLAAKLMVEQWFSDPEACKKI